MKYENIRNDIFLNQRSFSKDQYSCTAAYIHENRWHHLQQYNTMYITAYYTNTFDVEMVRRKVHNYW